MEYIKEISYILVCIEGIIIIILLSIILHLSKHIKESIIEKIVDDLDNFILHLSIILLLVSIALDFFNITSGATALILNIFTSLIFSWLLTKKSSETEFKKQQEKLAKLSHRHLCDVEASILSLGQSIKYYDFSNGMDNCKTFLEALLGRIQDIQNAIKSNEADWEDMLSKEYLEGLQKDDKLINNQKTEDVTKKIDYRIIHYKNSDDVLTKNNYDSKLAENDIEAAEVGDEEIAATAVDND